MSHTPGPWRLGKKATSCNHLVYITIKANKNVHERNKVFSTISARRHDDDVALSGVYAKNANNGRTIGETYKDKITGDMRYKPFISEDECMANANLIAAAPELLEALKVWEHWYNEDSTEFNRDTAREMGLKAIAKAEGK